jgi:hypothetical protein
MFIPASSTSSSHRQALTGKLSPAVKQKGYKNSICTGVADFESSNKNNQSSHHINLS